MPSPSPDAGHQPDYPPKTPPPPKSPAQPPRPSPDTKPRSSTGTVARTSRRAVTMANRRGANWTLEAQPWSVGRARTQVLDRLRDWGCTGPGPGPGCTGPERLVGEAVTLLVETALSDGGRRLSVHLADQDGQALVVVLSHRADLALSGTDVLPRLAALGATSCGTDMAEDGRRLWAVLDLRAAGGGVRGPAR